MANKTESTIILDNIPDSNALWKGLGGNFDSLTQIINEFIDNSLSDFIKFNQSEIKKIIIRITQKSENCYEVEIEDTGTGITDLASAFSIGNTDSQLTSLNEHGFGMKHSLAAANPDNDNWSVKTRTIESKDRNEYYEIRAPFDLSKQKVFIKDNSSWRGLQPTGTIIKFNVSNTLLKTISRGLRGQYKKLESLMEILAEDLGYTYGTYISHNTASISIRYQGLEMTDIVTKDISEIKPVYTDIIKPGINSTTLDLGAGTVTIDYEFLQAEESSNKKYYLANMATSGVEIRINGRLLASNLFSEIWGIEKHNSYNYILIRLNIKSDYPERLPTTTTNKTGLKQDDPKLESIYKWIRSKVNEPKRRASLSRDEIDLFNQLKDLKLKTLKDYDAALVVDREKHAFTSINEKIRIDLYQSFQNKTTIYEGKKDKTTPQDVYQLLMYWDGLTMDNVPVDKAILIATEHPDSVKALVSLKNQSQDKNGTKYNIEIKTWNDESIHYPN
ncbi:ATP-binding protein [Lactiplantibacillus plantarum]|uniref:ATP-binding protein n=1 Tax=Lactiplantibacillus plantarum TaxID=1590 RepID=UPI002551DB73|nr:ATP-binding protein [Lactiplantibacillus plantarum]WIR74284.1 ATP-binding protein [Lactiplantibacillus plantarum]